MDDSIKSTKEDSNIRGFYYDLQNSNKLMSISLHANMEWGEKTVVGEDGKETMVQDWIKWTGEVEEVTKTNVLGSYPYGLDPILTSIATEDFNIGIANSWSDLDGGDMIGNLWNSMRPLAPYAKAGSQLLKDRKARDPKSFDSKAVDWIEDKVNNKVIPFLDSASKYLNRALIVQGNRFTYYGGTGVSFGNLSLKTTIFPEYKDKKFVTIHEKLNKLYPYLIGKYIPHDGDNEVVNQFIGWQAPPGGFEADMKDTDVLDQRGTLKVKIGSYYSISNLVVRDANLVFSKQMVKNPTDPGVISPLYCELTISLQPATKYTDIALKHFVSGEGMSREIEDVRRGMESGLTRAKDEIKGLLKQ